MSILVSALAAAWLASAWAADRAPIYNEKADAKALVDQALARAKQENKNVLIQWGGNWCHWCYLLHDLFNSDQKINQTLTFEYDLVMVDSNNNKALAASLGTTFNGVPFVTVLDPSGRKLVDQSTDVLEVGDHHDPAKVLAFLEKWKPTGVDANALLNEAKKTAQRENKMVFIRFSTPTCGWCKKLDAFLETDIAKDVLGSRYTFLKIDQARMTNGSQLRATLAPPNSGGVPWFAFLDATGKALVTSEGPNGNIGYPGQPEELEYFLNMVKTASPDTTDKDLSRLSTYFQEHAH